MSRLLALVGLPLLITAAGLDPARADDWTETARAFDKGWETDARADPGTRDKLRTQKRAALALLAATSDRRAVALLLAAHKDQLKLIRRLLAAWEDRRKPWLKLEPSMRKVLEARSKAYEPRSRALLEEARSLEAEADALRTKADALDAGTPERTEAERLLEELGQRIQTLKEQADRLPVSKSENAWIEEGRHLQNLRGEVGTEEEIAGEVREAVADVLGRLEADDRRKGLTLVEKAIGPGKTANQRALVGVLGRIDADDVRERLIDYTRSLLAPMIQTALEALGRQHRPDNIDVLLGFLGDVRWQVRASAIEGLAFYREARVVEALIAGAREDGGVVQRYYFTALSRMLGATIPGDVEAWATWWQAHRAEVEAAWADAQHVGPVVELPAPVMVKRHAGSTSFYGIQTNSKHIVFLIDISGSMEDPDGAEGDLLKIDIAKRELKNAIRTLSAEDADERGEASFNIVAYAATVTVYKPGKMVPATLRNKEKAFDWIDDLQAVGATNIFDALVQAFRIISDRKTGRNREKGADTFFLMTDGKPTAGEVSEPDRIRAEIVKLNATRKIVIHTIGVGPEQDAAFLEKLAAENHGAYIARGQKPARDAPAK